MTKRVSLIIACLSLSPSLAWAWGPEGHRLVADVAEKNLNAKAKVEVKNLLGLDSSLADISNFADMYRLSHAETYNWHFVDIPLDATTYDPARDCKVDPKKGDCVIAAIDREIAILADTKKPAEDRLFALKMVVHFVGDEHQPLHAEDHNDKGGNDVKVKWFGRATNLHKVWDSEIIKETGLSESAHASQLNALVTKKEKRTVQQGTIEEWAQEAHQEARELAYAKLPKTTGGAVPELGDDYFDAVSATVETQLMRGGLRLAEILNRTLGVVKK